VGDPHSSAVPRGSEWAFEPKWDGFRGLLRLGDGGRWRLVSRHGRVWTEQFPEFAVIGQHIDTPVLLDGETVVLGDDGRPSFERLSARLAGRPGRGPRATFVAFDVLELDGQSLVDQPWSGRRQVLAGLHFDGLRAVANIVCDDGDALFAATRELGVEGIVAKKITARYVCGRRTRAWLKVKHRGVGWFDVVGWRPQSRTQAPAVIVAEEGRHVGSAIVGLPAPERTALHRFSDRFGVGDGARIRLPAGAQVRVEYTERSVRGLLREAVARDLRAALPGSC
jgi:bifunctional non-homologous end joining protein LigD